MYYYNSAYTTYNYAAGALGILVVAVVLTALLLVLVLPKQKDGHLPAFFQLLYDLFTPKALMIEKLLQVLYVFLNCLTVLFGIAIFFNGFFAGFGRIVLGLVILVVGPVLLRVIHELLLLAVMQVKATREITFLAAAEALLLDPSACMVVEDSTNGGKAAKAAGMSCVWFHNPDSGDQQIPNAVLEISSWDPSSAEKIMKVSEQ